MQERRRRTEGEQERRRMVEDEQERTRKAVDEQESGEGRGRVGEEEEGEA